MSKKLKLKLKLQSPFMTGNAETPDLTLDALLPRDANNHVVFPGSLLRGVMLDSLQSMSKLSAMQGKGLLGKSQSDTEVLMRAIFGAKSSAEGQSSSDEVVDKADRFNPQRRGVQFSNLTSVEVFPPCNASSKTRIERNNVSGSAQEGQMQHIEMIGKHGTPVDFELLLTIRPDLNFDDVKAFLELAMRPVTAIGSSKSAGFGKIKECSFEQIEEPIYSKLSVGDVDTITIRMDVDGALSIDNQIKGTNAYISETIIPGGAIKAAIADALGVLEPKQNALLSDMRVSHAFPAVEGKPPHQLLPLSVGFFKNSKMAFDAIGFEGSLLDASNNVLEPPQFSVDWKYDDNVPKIVDVAQNGNIKPFSPVKLKTQSFVRTQIDRESGSAKIDGESGQLFVNECVLPVSSHNEKVEWEFTVHSSDMTSVIELLNAANSNGMHLGKLSTAVEFKSVISAENTPMKPFEAAESNDIFVAIVLQTDALMFLGSEARDQSLHEVYTDYFSAVFKENGFSGSLTLDGYFAEQKLRGGYQALRYMGGRDYYEPWVLTKAGSVFSIKIQNRDSVQFLDALRCLLKSGLPARAGVYPLDWTNCPFVSENGYGAFLVNPLPRKWTNGALDNLIVVRDIVEQANVS